MSALPEEPLTPLAAAAADLVDGLPPTSRILVLADADTDGVASASLVARALHATGRRFTVRLSRRRDPRFFDELFAKPPAFLITADLGAASITRFQEARVPTVVLDHHEPEKDGTGPTLVHVNPHLVGEDGSKGASGAAVSWVFARTYLAKHGFSTGHLVGHALVGAEGDRYHGAESERGLHRRLLAYANDQGLKWQEGPALPDGPLSEALARSIDPYVVRFHTDPDAARDALQRIGIDPGTTATALKHSERRDLGTLLTLELVAQGADAAYAPRLFTPVPMLPDGTPVPVLAAMIDAACRHHAPTEALTALLGGEPERARIARYLDAYHTAIRRGLDGAHDLGALDTAGPAFVLPVESGPYSGPVADRVKSWLPTGPRPVVAYGPAGPSFKFSLRARETEKGPAWRLDEAADTAGRSVGGIGGGHRLAAGASVPQDKLDAFLAKLGTILADQAGDKLGTILEEQTA